MAKHSINSPLEIVPVAKITDFLVGIFLILMNDPICHPTTTKVLFKIRVFCFWNCYGEMKFVDISDARFISVSFQNDHRFFHLIVYMPLRRTTGLGDQIFLFQSRWFLFSYFFILSKLQ